MKKQILCILFFIFCFQFKIYPLFIETNFTAKVAGLAGTYVAISNDTNGLLSNPAGITDLDFPELNISYSNLYVGLDDKLSLYYLGFCYPIIKIGVLGFSYGGFDTENYKEKIIVLSYAKEIPYIERLTAGVNIKYLEHSFVLDKKTEDDPVFEKGASKNGFTADLGLKYKTYSMLYGFVIKNITQPNLGLKEKDVVPKEYVLGLAYNTNIWVIKNLLVACDISYREQTWGEIKNKITFSFATEGWFFNRILAVRFGLNNSQISLGFSFVVEKLNSQIDYATVLPLEMKDKFFSHRMTIVYKFGGR